MERQKGGIQNSNGNVNRYNANGVRVLTDVLQMMSEAFKRMLLKISIHLQVLTQFSLAI